MATTSALTPELVAAVKHAAPVFHAVLGNGQPLDVEPARCDSETAEHAASAPQSRSSIIVRRHFSHWPQLYAPWSSPSTLVRTGGQHPKRQSSGFSRASWLRHHRARTRPARVDHSGSSAGCDPHGFRSMNADVDGNEDRVDKTTERVANGGQPSPVPVMCPIHDVCGGPDVGLDGEEAPVEMTCGELRLTPDPFEERAVCQGDVEAMDEHQCLNASGIAWSIPLEVAQERVEGVNPAGKERRARRRVSLSHRRLGRYGNGRPPVASPGLPCAIEVLDRRNR